MLSCLLFCNTTERNGMESDVDEESDDDDYGDEVRFWLTSAIPTLANLFTTCTLSSCNFFYISDLSSTSVTLDSIPQVEQMASLQQRIEELQNEKSGLTTLNAELQKKAVALIAKEKAMQGQTAAARTAAEVCVGVINC